jgi:hypothetical protein
MKCVKFVSVKRKTYHILLLLPSVIFYFLQYIQKNKVKKKRKKERRNTCKKIKQNPNRPRDPPIETQIAEKMGNNSGRASPTHPRTL